MLMRAEYACLWKWITLVAALAIFFVGRVRGLIFWNDLGAFARVGTGSIKGACRPAY